MVKSGFIIGSAVAIVFVLPLLGVLGGAFSGWVVGLIFDDTIHATLAAFGVKADQVSTWQIGATLGFVGAFFRASIGKQ